MNHPDYDDLPGGVPAQDPADQCPWGPIPSFTGPVYRLVDNVDRPLGDWRVVARRSDVTVNVRIDVLAVGPNRGGDPLAGATVTIATPDGDPVGTQPTDVTGAARFPAVLPWRPPRVTVTRTLAGDWKYGRGRRSTSTSRRAAAGSRSTWSTRPGGVISEASPPSAPTAARSPCRPGGGLGGVPPAAARRSRRVRSRPSRRPCRRGVADHGNVPHHGRAPGTHVLTFTSDDAAFAAPAAQEVVITELLCVFALPKATYRRVR